MPTPAGAIPRDFAEWKRWVERMILRGNTAALTLAGVGATQGYVDGQTAAALAAAEAYTDEHAGGAVDSVNGKVGVVVLDAGDVGADVAGAAAAAVTPGAWVTPALLNSWAAKIETPQYRVEAGGIVRGQGRAQSGATGTVIFQLGVGARPIVRQDLPLVTDSPSGLPAFAQVATGGNVTITKPADATWVSLAGIRFPTT